MREPIKAGAKIDLFRVHEDTQSVLEPQSHDQLPPRSGKIDSSGTPSIFIPEGNVTVTVQGLETRAPFAGDATGGGAFSLTVTVADLAALR